MSSSQPSLCAYSWDYSQLLEKGQMRYCEKTPHHKGISRTWDWEIQKSLMNSRREDSKNRMKRAAVGEENISLQNIPNNCPINIENSIIHTVPFVHELIPS